MTVEELLQQPQITLLNPGVTLDKAISNGICCDLLSWAMAKGQEGMAWITVQTHMNVVAVATLHDFACIILSENNVMPDDVLQKACAEGIAVLQSPLSSYALCGLLYAGGIGQ
ncbi:MAG: AraC family transcriptional regulator [Eubacteriales bacterium]|nr:AraC family transcriptional regulator [Eubacteriales bacterium]